MTMCLDQSARGHPGYLALGFKPGYNTGFNLHRPTLASAMAVSSGVGPSRLAGTGLGRMAGGTSSGAGSGIGLDSDSLNGSGTVHLPAD